MVIPAARTTTTTMSPSVAAAAAAAELAREQRLLERARWLHAYGECGDVRYKAAYRQEQNEERRLGQQATAADGASSSNTGAAVGLGARHKPNSGAGRQPLQQQPKSQQQQQQRIRPMTAPHPFGGRTTAPKTFTSHGTQTYNNATVAGRVATAGKAAEEAAIGGDSNGETSGGLVLTPDKGDEGQHELRRQQDRERMILQRKKDAQRQNALEAMRMAEERRLRNKFIEASAAPALTEHAAAFQRSPQPTLASAMPAGASSMPQNIAEQSPPPLPQRDDQQRTAERAKLESIRRAKAARIQQHLDMQAAQAAAAKATLAGGGNGWRMLHDFNAPSAARPKLVVHMKSAMLPLSMHHPTMARKLQFDDSVLVAADKNKENVPQALTGKCTSAGTAAASGHVSRPLRSLSLLQANRAESAAASGAPIAPIGNDPQPPHVIRYDRDELLRLNSALLMPAQTACGGWPLWPQLKNAPTWRTRGGLAAFAV